MLNIIRINFLRFQCNSTAASGIVHLIALPHSYCSYDCRLLISATHTLGPFSLQFKHGLPSMKCSIKKHSRSRAFGVKLEKNNRRETSLARGQTGKLPMQEHQTMDSWWSQQLNCRHLTVPLVSARYSPKHCALNTHKSSQPKQECTVICRWWTAQLPDSAVRAFAASSQEMWLVRVSLCLPAFQLLHRSKVPKES